MRLFVDGLAAILCEHWEIADLLIRKGADPMAQDHDGTTAIALCPDDTIRSRLLSHVS